jgi:WD40 repeat protein
VVPAAVRLVSHKRSRQQVQDVVLAQVLESSCGVVWVVAFSRDGSFLAAAGQDCVLRVWQLAASRWVGCAADVDGGHWFAALRM